MPDTVSDRQAPESADYVKAVYAVMRDRRIRARFQSADADDIESDLMLALVQASQNYRPEDRRAKFLTYLMACLHKRVSGGCRSTRRFRARGFSFMRRRAVQRMHLFSEMGRSFLYSPLFATEPSAAAAVLATERRIPASRVTRVIGLAYTPDDRRLLIMKFGLDGKGERTQVVIARRLKVTQNTVSNRLTRIGCVLRARLEDDARLEAEIDDAFEDCS